MACRVTVLRRSCVKPSQVAGAAQLVLLRWCGTALLRARFAKWCVKRMVVVAVFEPLLLYYTVAGVVSFQCVKPWRVAGTTQLVCAYVSNLSWKSCIVVGTVHRRSDRALIETGLLACALFTLGSVVLWYGGRRFENTSLLTYVCVVIMILLLNVLLFRDACISVACACGLTSCVRYIIQWLQSGFRHYNCITCTFNMVCSNQGCA